MAPSDARRPDAPSSGVRGQAEVGDRDRADERPRHGLIDDVQGIAAGAVMVSLGLMFVQTAGLITGQLAGLALIVAYSTGWPLGPVLFVLNLPFWGVALLRLGWRFALKTLAALAAVTGLLGIGPAYVTLGPTHPLAAAVLGGLAAGFGVLALFRHGASMGGVGVLAIWLQDSIGFRAGWTQMLMDAGVFVLAFLVLEPKDVLISASGALVLNLFIALNHRRDRYVAI